MKSLKCPNCGNISSSMASFCNECGNSMEEAYVICPNCGEENQKKAKFCMNCAYKLAEEPIETKLKETKETEDNYTNDKNEISQDVETSNKNNSTTIANNDNSTSKQQSYIPEEPNKKKGKLKFIGIGIGAIILIFILTSLFSSPKITALDVSYEGDTAAGTVLDENNKAIKVLGIDEDGEKQEITGWTIQEAKTLKMDGSESITIVYKKLSETLTVECSTSELVEITGSYSGDAAAGVTLDSNNKGFNIKAKYKNGTEEEVEGWSVEEPQTLAADTTKNVVVSYEGKECIVEVICTTITIEKLTAKYKGSTKAGVKISSSSDIEVTAHYKNGKTAKVTGWKVEKEATLKEGETAKVKIIYGDNDCVLKVECTDLSKKQYKSKCKSYTYNEIARDPDDYKGKKAKFTGKVVQALESQDSAQVDMRLAIDDDYDKIIYVVYYMPQGSSRILEDDEITVYGELDGIYTYTSTMNAQITIPIMYASYVD